MPITMRWADERKTIFIFDLHTGDWDWKEYNAAVDQGLDRIKAVGHDVIAIVLSAPALPEGNTITHLIRAARLQPDSLRLYIIVGGNVIVRVTNNVLLHMYPKLRITFAASESEAYKLAAELGFSMD